MFQCPFCGGRADYKFNAASGWCDDCEATFWYTGGANLYLVSAGWRSTRWIQLEVDYGKVGPWGFDLEWLLERLPPDSNNDGKSEPI